MTDTVITLGDFTFQGMEIPQQINFGGQHQLVQHDLVGGQRVLDAMGRYDTSITWEGLMLGSDAISRAIQLNQSRISGEQLNLSWFNLNYTVVIEDFIANTERYYQVTYKISLRVLSDGLNPFSLASLLGIDQTLLNDLVQATGISTTLNIPALTTSMNSLNSAFSAVNTFNGASPTTINSVMVPLQSAQSQVTAQLSTVASRLFGS